jgi:hypothetical protein
MSMLKFKNMSNDNVVDMPIYINSDWIVAVYERRRRDSGSVSTVIFGGPGGMEWTVEESLSEVMKIIDEGTK